MMTSQIALVVEELTPGEKISPVVQRMLQYLKSGVPLVWLVDNEERCVIVYRKGDSSYLLKEGEELTTPHVVPGSPVRVSELLTPLGNESGTIPKAHR